MLIFGGLAPGAIGGLLYIALRKWIPGPRPWQGLVFGMLLLLTFGWIVINSDNKDFAELGIPSINILMFALLFVSFGLLIYPIGAMFNRLIPAVQPGLNRFWAYGFMAVPILLFLIFAVATTGIGGIIAFVVFGPYVWWPSLAKRFSRLFDFIAQRPRWQRLAISYFGLAIPPLIGSVMLSISIVAITS